MGIRHNKQGVLSIIKDMGSKLVSFYLIIFFSFFYSFICLLVFFLNFVHK